MRLRKNKKGAGEILGLSPLLIIGILAVLYFTGVIGDYKGGGSAATTNTLATTQSNTGPTIVQLQDDGCPTTKLTSLIPNVYNKLNETADNFDVTMRMYDATSQSFVATFTDTTNPSGTNVPCGRDYEWRILSVDGAMGDNSIISGVSVDGGVATVINDNVRGSAVQFKSAGGQQTFNIDGQRAGVLEFRSNDNILNDLDFSGDDASASDFELTAANFTGPSSNTSYTSVSAGQYLDKTLEFESATNTAWVNFIDQGGYACIDRSTTTWKQPSSVTLEHNGIITTLTDVKDQGKLTSGENEVFSDFEDCYLIPAGEYTSRMSGKLRVRVQANTDPVHAASQADNINVRFYAINNYLSRDGFTLKKGAATDAIPAAATSTLQRAFWSIA